MPTAIFADQVSTLGKRFVINRTLSADGGVVKDPTLAAAKSGQLTTRTDNNTGTLTMSGGHGITTAALLDVYWANTDGTTGVRYGMTVGTVATNSVPIDGGAGDNLPLNNTAITAMVPQQETFVVTAADLSALLVGCSGPAVVVFLDDEDAAVKACVVGSDDSFRWDAEDVNAPANPFDTTDVASAYFSQGSTTSKQVNAVAFVS